MRLDRCDRGRTAFRFADRGLIPVVSPSPEELQGYVRSEIVRWGKVVEQAGATGTELAAELHGTMREVISYGLDRIEPQRDVRIVLA